MVGVFIVVVFVDVVVFVSNVSDGEYTTQHTQHTHTHTVNTDMYTWYVPPSVG